MEAPLTQHTTFSLLPSLSLDPLQVLLCVILSVSLVLIKENEIHSFFVESMTLRGVYLSFLSGFFFSFGGLLLFSPEGRLSVNSYVNIKLNKSTTGKC